MTREQTVARAASDSGKSWRSCAASNAGGVVSILAAPIAHGNGSASASPGIPAISSTIATAIPIPQRARIGGEASTEPAPAGQLSGAGAGPAALREQVVEQRHVLQRVPIDEEVGAHMRPR